MCWYLFGLVALIARNTLRIYGSHQYQDSLGYYASWCTDRTYLCKDEKETEEKKKLFFFFFFFLLVFSGRSLSPSFFPDRGEMPKTPKFSFFY